jgi:hypothetical protein
MVRRPNYDQDKRRKELDRKTRQETKRVEREQRRSGRTEPESIPAALPSDQPA